ncbi:30S ribosomal protein 2, chloroplastic [Glycine soja]
MKRPTGPSIYANRKWIFSGTKHHLDNKINLRLCSQNQNLNFHCSFVTSSSLSHHTTMASLHSSFLLTSNFLSLTTPSSFPTHILFPVRLSTTHLRPLLLTTRHGFGRSPFAAVAEQAATATEAAVRRLYAGNIPRTVTNNELAKIVQEHGVVEKAENPMNVACGEELGSILTPRNILVTLTHHTTMASLHSSFLLTSNFLSLTTPSSSSTHVLFPMRLSTTHLRPLLLTTRHGFGRPPFAAVAEQAATATEASARRLYVGNIPRTVTNDELAKIVQEHGAVEKAEVMYDKYSGRSRRFAFVTMKTVEDATAVIEKLNGTEIGGREVKVNVTEKPLSTPDLPLLQAEESEFIDSPHKVYVGNLAKTVTTDTLKNFFSEKGKVLSAKVSRVPGTSKSSGYGFVTFSSEEDVEAAISSFNNSLLEGQTIRVNKA